MYYNGQSGRPYSYVYETDLNRDGGAFNDLLYYPRESEVTLLNGLTYQDLVSFLESGNCDGLAAGEIVKRNACRVPVSHSLDFRTAVNVPIGRFRPASGLASIRNAAGGPSKDFPEPFSYLFRARCLPPPSGYTGSVLARLFQGRALTCKLFRPAGRVVPPSYIPYS
jgi:hypothetical protein